jgi:pimeloyl-ACP methyl ester carboxylesterase
VARLTSRCLFRFSREVPDPDPIRPPSPWLLALEGRAFLELAALVPALPFLAGAPRGDGHPVLVMPGWLAGDASTRALRWFLRNRGYHAHGWRLGTNVGPSAEIVAGIGARFAALRTRHRRKVSVIGWSLGGIYARELARRFPDDVRQVITLASPFREPSATTVAWLHRAGLGRRFPSVDDEVAAQRRLRTPPPVPCTAIYSKTDGIAAWRSCCEEASPLTENVEVASSHCGIGHHPAALLVIADRLAQPEGAWRPFRADGWRRFVAAPAAA